MTAPRWLCAAEEQKRESFGLLEPVLAFEVLADPDHEEHESMLEWVGGAFEAEHFGLVNEALTYAAAR